LPGGEGSAREAAAAASPETLEQALDWSLSKKMHGAAIALVEILGQVGDASLLEDPEGQPRAVLLALLDSNRRVRYAAAQAIVGWNPVKAYPGSSRLPEVLGHFAATGGRRRVLVGHPRLGVAQTIAGHFGQLGFEADTATTGRQALLMALDSPDYAFAILSDALDKPGFGDLVQQLRKDPRTADLPIGLAVREVNQPRAEWLTDSDPLTLAFPLPLELEAAALDTRRLLTVAGRSQMSQAERIRQATFALDALGKFADQEESYSFYDVFRQQEQINTAVKTPELTSRAIRILGWLGSPAAQQRIVEVASDPTRTVEDRRAAVEAFKTAIQRRGLLLTRAEVLRQYELYNQSANLDQGTQQILGMLLDAMEAPRQKAADEGAGQ
jgi:CheY-like chemotaxis protein